MSEQVQRRRVSRTDDAVVDHVEATASVAPVDIDAILDEIDAALESDAEDYVRAFVQKGGQ